jgi:NhaP-type Na+/H+ and K+/H+ antiporter
VVNNINAPNHKAAKKFNTILTNCLHLDFLYNTINSESLATELTSLKINNNHRVLMLDIKDLYVNIPICETIHLTKAQLLKYNKTTTCQIIDLLDIILNQNYLSFQDQIYKPNKGVAMGSPNSGTITEVFLQTLEKHIIKQLMDN